LFGFDIDSCCVGFDGKDVLMTPRAKYSLDNMVNTVNLARMSPTYNYRLAKYMQRGFNIRVPGLDKNRIRYQLLTTDADRLATSGGKGDDGRTQYHLKTLRTEVNSLSGLSYLLLMTKMLLYAPLRVNSDYSSNSPYGRFDHKEILKLFPELPCLLAFSSYRKIYHNAMFYLEKYKSLRVPDIFYNEVKMSIPQDIQWKSQNPGEQLTNTFNKISIDQPSTWYIGKYYNEPPVAAMVNTTVSTVVN
jgi:hypothetical protein